ncbi:MAG: enoyl-CoA hydratase/isomerase family protein [Alphaproteobacteria bacterium]|nr:enoyl-CoA hydratase/isomerase family protein [Alphaproteobacteria bacterium]MBU1516040.1 enoyl-CoA hydratase/isomerase family protein [Alphaproteobacteria bacterium]MBU2092745.1 enoyl-CoA hydratase/isomerase family protein [Alphaproteobacteria bacterium]MBU2153730.1 enoyl-CoA hydratase/isomerase family protein [Alphaproteobacteria bacterium]MBU2308358.1 enoyl-CoA hydratase/isomerase family protein [Alphaproteobacteria bacterium]
MADDILVVEDLEGGAQRLTFNRPDRLNAINHPMAEALLAYFEGLRRNRDVRVVIVRGAGRAFSAGADLKAMGSPEALQDGPRGDWVLRDLMRAMRVCPQPLVATVRGAAAGGGMAIALNCDIILASESAAFHSAFTAIGLSGTELGVSWRLQRMIGISKAREVLMAGRPLLAAAALESGLVSAVTAEADLDEAGLAMARDMLKAAPDALRLSKRAMDASLEQPSFDAAVEAEERSQMLMIVRRGQA